MKTIITLICLLALVSCKKEEVKPEEKVIPYVEARFYGNWAKFQADISYYKSEGTVDSVAKINWDEIEKTPPFTKPVYINEGYKLPYTTKSLYHIAVQIMPESKYNMEEGEWVYVELYSDGVRVAKTDTIDKYNPGGYISH